MLRNWLVLVSEESLSKQIKEGSTYKSVESLKEVRVALLSGEFSGVVVLSILDSDNAGFSGFISGLKNHPELKKVQVVLLDRLMSLFSTEEKKSVKFYTLEQIAKLIDLDLNSEKTLFEDDIDQSPPLEISKEDYSEDLDSIEYLKHISARIIANMILKGQTKVSKEEALETFVRMLNHG